MTELRTASELHGQQIIIGCSATKIEIAGVARRAALPPVPGVNYSELRIIVTRHAGLFSDDRPPGGPAPLAQRLVKAPAGWFTSRDFSDVNSVSIRDVAASGLAAAAQL